MSMTPELNRDSLGLLIEQEQTRVQELLGVRHSRMAVTPFTYFRGAAIVMASDLAKSSHSEQMVQLCGDAHILNFGFYASPERQLLFDINDFDETFPGPYEWDVIRLATSVLLAAQSNGFSSEEQEEIGVATLRSYAQAMAEFAEMPFMAMWPSHLSKQRLLDKGGSKNLRNHLKEVVSAALKRDSRQAAKKLCEIGADGEYRFKNDPPLIWRTEQLPESWRQKLDWDEWGPQMFANYFKTVRPDVRHVFSHYRLIDSAIKVVGVGSVGTRCAISLFVGQHPEDLLILQGKEAMPSVLATYLDLPSPEHQGQRVVQGQRLMQTASDFFLGWASNPNGEHTYIRHFRDWKGSVDVSCLDSNGLSDYSQLCAWTIAKAHARTGNRVAISAHIGKLKRFTQLILDQANRHAQLNAFDYARLLQAMASGDIASDPLA
jgi:uncharacterized protein (DUF2252 family)